MPEERAGCCLFLAGIGEMLRSFERMFGIFTVTKNWDAWSKTVHFRFADKPPTTTKELKLFNILHSAIKEKKVVEFTYKGH